MFPPPRKRFGQHFLHDRQILQRMVDLLHLRPDDLLVEIGPGRGALTRPLLEQVQRLIVVELDRDLLESLRDLAPSERLEIHSGDALQFSFADLASPARPLRLVGNLPYNISTPLLFHLLQQTRSIRDMHFLLQKEVVDRLAARPGSPDYGRLSVMLQAQAEAHPLFDVAPGAFRPPPRVQSTFVRILPLPEPLVPPEAEPSFARVVQQSFSQRRKTLRRSLASLLSADTIEACGIDSQARPETLPVADFLHLAQALSATRRVHSEVAP